MDLIIFSCIALYFIYSIDTEVVKEEKIRETKSLETRLNPSFYHDEHAFERLAKRLLDKGRL